MIRTTVRKSRCSKDSFDTPLNRGIRIEDPPIAQVTITNSEDEEYQYDSEDGELPPGMATLFVENAEDKIDYVIQVLESHGKKYDTLVSKATNGNSSDGEGSETTYKGLCVDSQRKIEALTEENHQLTMKLTIADAKIEMLTNNPQHLADLAGKVRDIVMPDLVPTPAFNVMSSEDATVHVPTTERKRGKYQRK